MPLHYPFSAVVGSDDMALALLLNAVSPSAGGVLIRGEKGTAKSTMVRALAGILPQIEVVAGDRFSSAPSDRGTDTPDGPIPHDAPTEHRPVRLVELPIGATEDRIAGSLHLEKALSEGVTAFEPGLLARAHRGLLYVDEVNLLHDHVVDQLLDAAAMGRVTVERDGVSVEHAARFVLIGTMNPEEGELRPQLLDRFGLTVEVSAPREAALRAEVIRRRVAFDSDPEGFSATFAADELALRERIVAARERV
ncbi:ATP-binding protein, partial [Dietzia cercidiphylli]